MIPVFGVSTVFLIKNFLHALARGFFTEEAPQTVYSVPKKQKTVAIPLFGKRCDDCRIIAGV